MAFIHTPVVHQMCKIKTTILTYGESEKTLADVSNYVSYHGNSTGRVIPTSGLRSTRTLPDAADQTSYTHSYNAINLTSMGTVRGDVVTEAERLQATAFLGHACAGNASR